MSGHCKVKA